MIDRLFVEVAGQRIHYRRAGNGPVVLLLPDPPDSSRSLLPVIEDLAQRHTVIAPDLPGTGLSDPLRGDSPAFEEYVVVLAGLLDALGLSTVDVFGHGAGAVFARGLALAAPDRVRSVGAHRLPQLDPAEQADQLANLCPVLAPEWDGGHLVRAWALRRDRHIWDPWYRRTNETRLAEEFPDAETLYEETLDLLRAGPDWGKATRAAIAATISPRANVVEWHAGDTFLPRAYSAWLASLAADCGGAPPPPPARTGSGFITYGFAPTSAGLLFYRRSGPAEGRPLVMFHASPGTSAAMEPNLLLLGTDRPVYAFDNPGYGDSAALPGEPSVADLAAVQIEALDALGIGACDLYGALTGAFIAIEIAIARPDRVHRLIVEALPLWRQAEAESLLELHAPAMPLNQDGSHLVWAWNIIRDRFIWSPWENKTIAGGMAPRVRAPFPDVQSLHERVIEFLKGARTYHHPYRAVFRHPTRERLPLISVPALAAASATSGSRPALARIESLLPGVKTVEWPGLAAPAVAAETARIIRAFLDG